jgi:hypothetical protein
MADNADCAMPTPWADIEWQRTDSDPASGLLPRLQDIASIVAARIGERCDGSPPAGRPAPRVELAIRRRLGPEAYALEDAPGGVRVAGGAGRLLRESSYEGGFSPAAVRLRSRPRCSVRGMYFATHFFNWYHMASREELVRYVEDLALWGVNAIATIFPIIDLKGWDDPRTEAGLRQVRNVCGAAREAGLQVCLLTCNVGFQDLPDRLRAVRVPDPLHRHGNLGNTMCPSDPTALEHMLAIRRRLFAELEDVGLDLVCLWPYDEGGCGCPKCAPWGANGFLRFARAVADLGHERFPDLKVILSTWTFDTPPQGEWEGLSRALDADGGWVDYILAASHDDFPRYPLEHGVPGGKPMLDFPEISMWGLGPWGGLGATPLPQRFQNVWNQAGHALDGGFPYSEGIYEDINKVIYSQFFWDADQPAWETLRQYAAYEFSPRVANDVVRIAELIEWNHTEGRLRERADPGRAEEAYELARQADTALPERARVSWRWRILFLRTLLDRERFRIAGAGPWPEAKWNERWRDVLRGSAVAQDALRELMAIYHCPPDPNDADHHHRNFLRPPLAADTP